MFTEPWYDRFKGFYAANVDSNNLDFSQIN